MNSTSHEVIVVGITVFVILGLYALRWIAGTIICRMISRHEDKEIK